MKSFAFITSPATIKQLKTLWPAFRFMPELLIKSSLRKMPPCKVLPSKRIRSIHGKESEGYFIICPLLSRETAQPEDEFIRERFIGAARIAIDLDVGILGMDGCADKDCGFAKSLKIPVTNGNVFTAWSVFEAIYRIVKVRNLSLKDCSLAVIGANLSLGKLCSRKLSGYVRKIILSGGNREMLERLKGNTAQLNPVEVDIEEQVTRAVKEAAVVINADSALQLASYLEELKPDTIVCDVYSDSNVNKQGITFIRGGLIKLPLGNSLGINTGLPKSIISASMAETILLALEERFVSYSIDEDTNLDKLEEMADIAARHGFEVWVPEAPVL